MAASGFSINDLQLIDPALSTFSPVPTPAAGVHLTSHTSEGAADRAFARSTNRPVQLWKAWIVQSTRAKARAVAEQVLEIANNPVQQPCYVQFGGGQTELDGWYHVAGAQNWQYLNDFTGTLQFDLSLQKEAASSRVRYLGWSDASLTVAPGGSTAVGLPGDAVAPATTVSRTGAEGAVVAGVSLAANGVIQVAAGVPTFTTRVRVFDRNTGAAASTLGTGQISLTGWTEVYGHDHVFVSDCILTNGLTMVVLASGSTPAVYNYIGTAWVLTGNLTMANSSTQLLVKAASALQVFSERSMVVAQVAASGFQGNLAFTLDRGMYHVDLVGEMKQGSGNLYFVSPKNIKLWMSDSGLMDASIPDPLLAPVTNSYLVGQSADTTMTWFPVWASSSLSNFAAPLTVTTIPQVSAAVNTYERGMFGIAPLASGNTALYQQEAESLTLVGAGATNVVDAAGSAGHTVQCAGTETTEGVSFVPGTDGIGVATGITYGVTARVRVDASDAQVCRIETPAATSMTLITSHTYGVQSPVQVTPTTAATSQIAKVLRARYRDIVLNDTPIRYFRKNDTNATMVDSSVNAANGTYTASPTQSVAGALTAGGDTDNAVTYNGTTQRATATNLTAYTTVSLECWFKIAGNPSADAWPMIWGQIGTNFAGVGLVVDSSGRLRATDVTENTGTSSAVSLGAYHHGVATADGTNLKVYLDGSLVSSVAQTGALNLLNTGTNSGIAAVNNGSSYVGWFPGTVDEVAYYPSVLSLNQILSHYQAGKALGHLFIDEVGVLPLKNSNNGPLDIYGQWAADRVPSAPTFK